MTRMFKMPFGKFKDLTLEQILFKRDGYQYLEWMATEIRNGRWRNDVPELKWINWTIEQSRKMPVNAFCADCSKPAIWTSIRGNREFGYSMSEEFIYCNQCKKERERYYESKTFFLRLTLNSVKWFAVKSDQEQFLALLRRASGMPKRLTANYLRKLFLEISDQVEEEDDGQVIQEEMQSTLF